MKRSFYAVGLLTAALSTSLFGQTATTKVTVPFNFHVGQTVLPAGDYIVKQTHNLLVIKSTESTETGSAAVLTVPASRSAKSANPLLQFQRYGSDYFLSKAWYGGGSADGRSLPMSKRERELASRPTFKTTEQVALRETTQADRNGR